MSGSNFLALNCSGKQTVDLELKEAQSLKVT